MFNVSHDSHAPLLRSRCPAVHRTMSSFVAPLGDAFPSRHSPPPPPDPSPCRGASGLFSAREF
eukprot:15463043-Alexandrium_andersonii.AAC.1